MQLGMSALGQKRTPSFDHLSSVREHRRRHAEAKRFGSFDNQLKLGRSLYREVGWLLTLQNAIDVTGCAAVLVDYISPVGN